MSMSNPLIRWLKAFLGDTARGLEGFCGRYYGVYPGVCIDNRDPENRGRIRFLCPDINLRKADQVSSNYWARPSMNGVGVDPVTGQLEGDFHPPGEKTNVWLMFVRGDTRYPVYIGGFVTTKMTSDTFNMDDPKEIGLTKRGIRTRSGHFLRFDDNPNNLDITISKGDGKGGSTKQFFSMTKDGETLLTDSNGSYVYMNPNDKETSVATLDPKGNVLSMLLLGDDKITMTTKSGGAFGIDGKDIVLTGDNVVADCSKQFSANAGTVMLGKGAREPVIRGNRFALGWGLLHQHITTLPTIPTLTGPTPPVMLYNELSESVFIS